MHLVGIVIYVYALLNSDVLAPWSASSLNYIFQCGLFGAVEVILISSISIWNIFGVSRAEIWKKILKFTIYSFLYFSSLTGILLLFGIFTLFYDNDQYIWELPLLPVIILLNLITVSYLLLKKAGSYYEKKTMIR